MTGSGESKTRRDTTGPRRMRGFEPAAGLLREPIRKAGESRGFAAATVLTHWAEIAGSDLAPLCRPVKVSHADGGLGGTLVLLTSGAAAPMVQMQLPALKERINAAYGYAAIARIRLTQTSERLPAPSMMPGSAPGLASGMAHGMAEAQAPFSAAPTRPARGDNFATPSGAALGRAREVVAGLTDGVSDDGLRDALDRLARNVLGRQKAPGGKHGPH